MLAPARNEDVPVADDVDEEGTWEFALFVEDDSKTAGAAATAEDDNDDDDDEDSAKIIHII